MLSNSLDEKKPALKPIPPSMERKSTLNGITEGTKSLYEVLSTHSTILLVNFLGKIIFMLSKLGTSVTLSLFTAGGSLISVSVL